MFLLHIVLFYMFQAQKQNRIQRRGASFALTAITLYFGRNLPQKLPKLWEIMINHLKDTVDLATFGEWCPFLYIQFLEQSKI
jgi:hypothetical protein